MKKPPEISGKKWQKKIGGKKWQKKVAEKNGGNDEEVRQSISMQRKQEITDFLQSNPSAKASEIAESVGLGGSRTRKLILEMVTDGIVKTEGEGRSRRYSLNNESQTICGSQLVEEDDYDVFL